MFRPWETTIFTVGEPPTSLNSNTKTLNLRRQRSSNLLPVVLPVPLSGVSYG